MGSVSRQTLVYKLFIVIYFSGISLSWSTTFVLPLYGDVVGELQYTHADAGETLNDVGLRYDMGYDEMVRANSRIDPTKPLMPGTRIVIPSEFILPQGSRQGIVINIAEYRLYYFPPNDNVVVSMPVGIGRKGWSTPIGVTKIVDKERNPHWRPTAYLKAEAEKNGVLMPDIFPSGEGNPLGKHVLRLGWPTYLIHGTHHREGVGSRVSAGCLRMLPEDIEYLFDLVELGTPVRVINQPVKLGRSNDAIYIQLHPTLIEQKDNLSHLVAKQLTQLKAQTINEKTIKEELDYPTGMLRKITF